jgi:hypothetical protein
MLTTSPVSSTRGPRLASMPKVNLDRAKSACEECDSPLIAPRWKRAGAWRRETPDEASLGETSCIQMPRKATYHSYTRSVIHPTNHNDVPSTQQLHPQRLNASTPQHPVQPPLTSHSINDTDPLILYPHATLPPSTQPHISKHYLRSNLTPPEYTPTLPDPPARIFRATSRSLRRCCYARSHDSIAFVLRRHYSDRFGFRTDKDMRFGND